MAITEKMRKTLELRKKGGDQSTESQGQQAQSEDVNAAKLQGFSGALVDRLSKATQGDGTEDFPDQRDLPQGAGRALIDKTEGLREGGQELGEQFLRGGADAVAPLVGFSPLGANIPRDNITLSGEDIARQVEGIPEGEAEGLLQQSGRLSGLAAGIAPQLGLGAAGLGAKVAPAVTRGGGRLGQQSVLRAPQGAKEQLAALPQRVRNLVGRTGEAFVRNPGRFAAEEATIGALAGAGGFAAQQKFPDSGAAKFVGELAGGFLPAFTPLGLAVRGGKRAGEFLRHPFQEVKSKRRAAERAQRAPTEEAREQALRELDGPSTIDPETGEPVLPAATRTGDPSLISMQRLVEDSSEELRRYGQDRLARANQVLQQELRKRGGDEFATTANIERAHTGMRTWLDARLAAAAKDTNRQVSKLGERASREDANRIARQRISEVDAAAKKQERFLFNQIDAETQVPAVNVTNRFKDTLGELSEAESGDVPAVAKRLLNPESDNFLGDITTVKQLRGLQSKLREEARNARSGQSTPQNANKARIADDLADSITEDFAEFSATAEGGQADAIAIAVRFSRDYKQAFRRGEIGKLFGRDQQGGVRVPESLTLERTIAGGGPASREAFDQITSALDNPAIVERVGGDSQGFVEAAEQFTVGRFVREAVQDGELNPKRAQQFLINNEELLSRMPSLQQELQEAVQSGNKQLLRAAQAKRAKFDDPRVSKAALMTQTTPVETFNRLSKGSPERAATEVQRLINMTKRDQTGEAFQGLKGGFLEYIMRNARQGQGRDITGEQFLSGFELRDLMENPANKRMISKLFTEDERKWINTLQRDLVKLDKLRTSAAPVKGQELIGDAPSRVLEAVAGVTGAASGRRFGRAVGSAGTVQIPGIFANRFRAMVNEGIKDPASRLIKASVHDEPQLRELLSMSLTKEGELPKRGKAILDAWTSAVIANNVQLAEDEPEQEQQGQQGPAINFAPQQPQQAPGQVPLQ